MVIPAAEVSRSETKSNFLFPVQKPSQFLISRSDTKSEFFYRGRGCSNSTALRLQVRGVPVKMSLEDISRGKKPQRSTLRASCGWSSSLMPSTRRPCSPSNHAIQVFSCPAERFDRWCSCCRMTSRASGRYSSLEPEAELETMACGWKYHKYRI